MTVSPRRAQDGQQPQSIPAQPADPPLSGQVDLPPLLFTLRNLTSRCTPPLDGTQAPPELQEPSGDGRANNAHITADTHPWIGTPTASDQQGDIASQPAQTPPTSETSGSAPHDRPSAAIDWLGRPARNSDTNSDAEDAPAPPANTIANTSQPLDEKSHQRSTAVNDLRPGQRPTASKPQPGFPPYGPGGATPAGRTWMERLGSHALVLSMLLIVVAAALLTGRDQSDHTTPNDSLANSPHSEIDFSTGPGLDLPIPEHDYRRELVPDASTANPSFVAQDSLKRPGQPWQADPARSELAGRDLPPASFANDHAMQPHPYASSGKPASSTELNQPRPDRYATANAYADEERPMTGVPPSGTELGEIFDASNRVAATTVSNRDASQDEALAVPTLEELESSAITNVTPPSTRGPRFTRTPFGISDADLLMHHDLRILERAKTQATIDVDPAASNGTFSPR